MKMKSVLTIIFTCVITLCGSFAFAQDLRLGTGGEKGVYNSVAGPQLSLQTRGSKLNVILVPGKGSLDNIEKMKAGEIDAAFVQPDALLSTSGFEYQIVTQFHSEFGQLITLADGPKSIKNLTDKDIVAIGANGGGTSVTWANFVKQDESYKKIPTVPLHGALALSDLESGKIKAVFRVSGLKDGEIMRANNIKGKFKLMNIDDWDFNDKIQGKDIYTFTKISKDTYPNLIGGVFGGSVETVELKSVLIVSAAWIEANSDLYEQLYDAANKAVPNVIKAVSK